MSKPPMFKAKKRRFFGLDFSNSFMLVLTPKGFLYPEARINFNPGIFISLLAGHLWHTNFLVSQKSKFMAHKPGFISLFYYISPFGENASFLSAPSQLGIHYGS